MCARAAGVEVVKPRPVAPTAATLGTMWTPVFLESSTCEKEEGLERIDDKAACEAAAVAEGLSDTTADAASSSSYPRGCVFKSSSSGDNRVIR